MKRLSIIKEVDDLIRGNCRSCTKVGNTPHKDLVAADREICASCPVGSRLLELGVLLDEHVRQSREGKDIPFIYEEPEIPESKIIRPDRKPGPAPGLTREVYERCVRAGMMQKDIAISFGVNVGSMKYWARKWSMLKSNEV